MTNEKMKEGRFLRLQNAKRKVSYIRHHLLAGHTVYIRTALKSTKYSKKHADMFKAAKSGAYVQRGKGWDCIDWCGITVTA